MPFQDAELDFRKGKRDQASRKLDDKRRALNAVSEHRNLLKSMYDQKLNFYSSRIPSLKETIAYYRQESQTAYANRDGAAAKSWSEQAKQLRSELDEAYGEKNRMLEELKEAGARFRAALEEFREAQAEFNQARDSFNERLNILKEESARKRAKWEEERRKHQQHPRLLETGRVTKLLGPGSREEREWWFRYGKASFDKDTQLDQTNFYAGYVGEKDQRKKVHIAINELGDIILVRDVTGETLYDRKHGIGQLPPDLDFSN